MEGGGPSLTGARPLTLTGASGVVLWILEFGVLGVSGMIVTQRNIYI